MKIIVKDTGLVNVNELVMGCDINDGGGIHLIVVGRKLVYCGRAYGASGSGFGRALSRVHDSSKTNIHQLQYRKIPSYKYASKAAYLNSPIGKLINEGGHF